MKNKLRYISILVFLLQLFLLQASAQTWMWGRQSTGGSVASWAAATDAAGNVYGAGSTLAYSPARQINFGSVGILGFTFRTGGGVSQAVWVKYDPAGNVLWAGGTQSGQAKITDITTDPSDNLILFGTFWDTVKIGSFVLTSPHANKYEWNYFIAKLDPSGNVLWAIAEGPPPSTTSLGGVFWEGGVITDSVGDIYVASSYHSTTLKIGNYTFTNQSAVGSSGDIFVAKYTSSGTNIWANTIAGNREDGVRSITVTSNGYLYIGGTFQSPTMVVGPSIITATPTYTAYIAQFSAATGAPLWAQSGLGGSNPNGSRIVGLAHDSANNIYVGGYFSDSSITFGTTIIRPPFPITGYISWTSFVAQLSPSNNINWSRTVKSPNQRVQAIDLALSPCGRVWLSGGYMEKAILGPADTVAWVPGNYPAFIVSYDYSGNVMEYNGLGSSGWSYYLSTACDNIGNLYVCSFLDPSSAYPTLTIGPNIINAVGGNPMYMAKYGQADTVYVHKDTTSCAAITGITLTAPAGYRSYFWDDSSIGASRNISGPGQYKVYCSGCFGKVLINTFNVIASVRDTVYNDTSICAFSTTVNLMAPAAYSSIYWNTGSTDTSISVSTEGTYFVTATENCSTIIRKFNVIFSDLAFSLGNDTIACDPVTLYAPAISSMRTWQDGSTGTEYLVDTSGIYSLSISSRGCVFTDSISINILDVAPHLQDEVFCREQPIQFFLKATNTNGGDITWSDGSRNDSLLIKDTGTYWVLITQANCTGSDTMTVTAEKCDCIFYIPNAFTPNADNRNDIFRPLIETGCPVKDYWFAIYNRWGQQVFFSDIVGNGWDGNVNGNYCELGTYGWLLKYTGGTRNTAHTMKGDLTLIR